MMRNFIWSGDINKRKICTVAWKNVCKAKERGLAVKEPSLVNQSSLLLLCWKLLTLEEQWATMCRAKFLTNGKPKSHYIISSNWCGLKEYISVIRRNSTWTIGNGESVQFWIDRWLDRSMVDHWKIPESLHGSLQMLVADYILEGNWNIQITSGTKMQL